MKPPPDKRHLTRVDVLRAAAILLVFSSHFENAVLGSWVPHWQGLWAEDGRELNPLEYFLKATFFNGAMGVDLFFIISGLCIRWSQRNAEEFTVGAFYWRRFFRIYPPYLLMLLVVVTAHGMDILHSPGRGDFIAHLFLAHNFWDDYFTSINGPFWSLALEAQVYLLYPLLLWAWEKLGQRRTLIILFVLSFAPPILGGNEFRARFHLPAEFAVLTRLPTTLWFTWALGFMIADQLFDRKPAIRVRWVAIVLLLAGAGLALFFKPLAHFRAPLSGLGLAALVSRYLNADEASVSCPRWLVTLGLCSYSFYLCFEPMMNWFLPLLINNLHLRGWLSLFAIGYPAALGIIFAVSWVLWRWVELPSISLGRKLRSVRG